MSLPNMNRRESAHEPAREAGPDEDCQNRNEEIAAVLGVCFWVTVFAGIVGFVAYAIRA